MVIIVFALLYFVIIVAEKKSKYVPAHAVEAYSGSRDTAPLILNLGARRR